MCRAKDIYRTGEIVHLFTIIIIARRVVMLSHLFFTLDFHNCDLSQQGRIYA